MSLLIKVENVPADATESDIGRIFLQYGPIRTIALSRRDAGWFASPATAVIAFENESSVEAAITTRTKHTLHKHRLDVKPFSSVEITKDFLFPFILGFTGSGKTTLTRSLIHQLEAIGPMGSMVEGLKTIDIVEMLRRVRYGETSGLPEVIVHLGLGDNLAAVLAQLDPTWVADAPPLEHSGLSSLAVEIMPRPNASDNEDERVLVIARGIIEEMRESADTISSHLDLWLEQLDDPVGSA